MCSVDTSSVVCRYQFCCLQITYILVLCLQILALWSANASLVTCHYQFCVLIITCHHRLAWDKADYGGVSVFRIDPHKLWLPDIEVYNNAVSKCIFVKKKYLSFLQETSHFSIYSQFSSGSNALVYPDGEVLYIPPVSLKVE